MHRTGSYCIASNLLQVLSFGTIYFPPFGSLISTPSWSDPARAYRYGFNRKEKDNETTKDDFPIAIGIGARIYDGSLGRFLSRDPKWEKYQSISNYTISFCNPIEIIDNFGLEPGLPAAVLRAMAAAGVPVYYYEYALQNEIWVMRKQYQNIDANRFNLTPEWGKSINENNTNQSPNFGNAMSNSFTPRPYVHPAQTITLTRYNGMLNHQHGLVNANNIVAMAQNKINGMVIGDGVVVNNVANPNQVIALPASDPRVPDYGGTISVTNSTTQTTTTTTTVIDRIVIRGSFGNRKSMKAAKAQLSALYPNAKIEMRYSLRNTFKLSVTNGPYNDGCNTGERSRISGVEVLVESTTTTTTTSQTTDTQTLNSNMP